MKKVFIEYELQDGPVGRVRALAADKVRAEHTARVNGWEIADGPRISTLILFHAMTRLDLTSSPYQNWLQSELADFEVQGDEEEEDEGDDNPPSR